MFNVVDKKWGTGYRIKDSLLTMAGKTGTSQVYDPKLGRYSKTQYVASFGGFTPAKDPRVSILVLIRNPRKSHYGGVVAAPVFREIARKTMLIQKVFPEHSQPNEQESIRISRND